MDVHPSNFLNLRKGLGSSRMTECMYLDVKYIHIYLNSKFQRHRYSNHNITYYLSIYEYISLEMSFFVMGWLGNLHLFNRHTVFFRFTEDIEEQDSIYLFIVKLKSAREIQYDNLKTKLHRSIILKT